MADLSGGGSGLLVCVATKERNCLARPVTSRTLQCWFVPRPWTRACWCASAARLPLRFKLPHTLPAAVLARNGKGYGSVEEAAVELARCRKHGLIHRCSCDCWILGQTRFGYRHASPGLNSCRGTTRRQRVPRRLVCDFGLPVEACRHR